MKYNTEEFPPGWDEERMERVLQHYDTQTDEEAAAEDDARLYASDSVVVEVPRDLLPAIRELIAKHSPA